MYLVEFLGRARNAARTLLLLTGLWALPPLSSMASPSITLAWDPSTGTNVAGYHVYCGGSSGNYTNTIDAGDNTTATVTNLTLGATYYFAATAYDSSGLESAFSSEISYTVPASNAPPTLDALANVTINENAGLQVVNLTGISSGSGNQVQTLTVTATSSNTGLIPNPTVTYTSANPTGAISFTPVAYAFGSSTITVTVNDGSTNNNTVSRSLTVTVNPVNQPPTLNGLANMSINENAALQTVNLSSISSGAANESQTLTVTATSSNTGLIPNPTVTYSSPNATGSIAFRPVAYGSGSATITVTVNDGGTSNNIVSQSFTVTVNPVNQPPTLNALANVTINENAAAQTVNLSGISSGAANESQTLTVTATSSNTGLIPNPTVTYSSPNATGSIAFRPVAYASGSATITVTVNDGGTSNNIVSQSFTVTVNPVNQPPTLNALANMTINENAAAQTVSLSGISSGAANEFQTLTVTATSSNTGLIPNPTITYTSPNTTGSIAFTPVAYGSGSATITVTVNDGGTSNNIVSQSFTVTVNPVNQPPTLSALANMTINENAGLQTVNLSGISSGAANESQTLTVTATSSNTGLIPNPTVSYTSANSTGSIGFTPVANGFGSSTITVTVNDGGTSNNIVSQSFTVTVNPVTQAPTLNALANMTIIENAAAQTVSLSGIGSGAPNQVQTLTVTAISSNTGLIPNPTITYTSPNATGSITFAPVTNAYGSASITVTVNNGGASNNIVSQSFAVTVDAPPTISALTDRVIAVGTSTPAISFTIGDADGSVWSLTLSASSSNVLLVPNSYIVLGGSGGNRTVTVTPIAGQVGTATITLTVSDGYATASSAFNLSVRQRPAPPGDFHVAQALP
jgi:fibronectin type 3 domain-containing protein